MGNRLALEGNANCTNAIKDTTCIYFSLIERKHNIVREGAAWSAFGVQVIAMLPLVTEARVPTPPRPFTLSGCLVVLTVAFIAATGQAASRTR